MRYALNTVPVAGWATYFGFGTADMALTESGAGQVAKQGSGTAPLALTMSGKGQIAKQGSGIANLALTLSGKGQIAKQASGRADMALTTRHGIPSPMPRPGDFQRAHPSRFIVVAPEFDYTRVAQDDRTFRVPPEPRVFMVPRERQMNV